MGPKTSNGVISNVTKTTNGASKVTRNFEKVGDYSTAEADFNSMQPQNVKNIQTQYGPGKSGTLSDGLPISVRPGSGTGGSTIDIKFSGSNKWKIIYN